MNILRRLWTILRAEWTALKTPPPKPTVEEVDMMWKTLPREEFDKWFNQHWPLQARNGTWPHIRIENSIERIQMHPNYRRYKKLFSSLRDGDEFIAGGERCVMGCGPKRQPEDKTVEEAAEEFRNSDNRRAL